MISPFNNNGCLFPALVLPYRSITPFHAFFLKVAKNWLSYLISIKYNITVSLVSRCIAFCWFRTVSFLPSTRYYSVLDLISLQLSNFLPILAHFWIKSASMLSFWRAYECCCRFWLKPRCKGTCFFQHILIVPFLVLLAQQYRICFLPKKSAHPALLIILRNLAIYQLLRAKIADLHRWRWDKYQHREHRRGWVL